MTKRKLAAYFIVGPTAVGKTEVAHYLAVRRGMAVLSADSMAIYRGMDIGTSKPSAAQRREVRYFGVDIVDPSEGFSAGQYRAYALGVLEGLSDEGVPVVVVGGTGLYIKFLTHGAGAASAADRARRAQWEAVYAEQGVAGLCAELGRLGGLTGELAEERNPRRLIRALERQESGVCGGASWGDRESGPIPCLQMDVAERTSRIRARVDAMYAAGLVREARDLSALGLSGTALQAIGYREAALVAGGELGEGEAKVLTCRRTVQLAKRQATWFRHQERCRLVDVCARGSVAEVAAEVERWWDEDGPVEIE